MPIEREIEREEGRSYLGASVHGGESVWGQVTGRAHGEGVGDTEQRRHAEDLGQVGTQAGEHEVGQKDILLHFPGEVIDSARVGQTKHRPSVGERVVCIAESRRGGVVGDKGER